MATAVRKFSRQIIRQLSTNSGQRVANKQGNTRWMLVALGTGSIGVTGILLYRKLAQKNDIQSPVVYAKDVKEEKLNRREQRFQAFASTEYDGNIYMTPQDFLESVTEGKPRPRRRRNVISHGEKESLLKHTPARHKGSNNLFRSLHEKGLISYTEYLFLLCVLTKPQSGFRIAFNMFDTDGNQKVDKKEFLVLQFLVSKFLHQSLNPYRRRNRPASNAQTSSPSSSSSSSSNILSRIFGSVPNDDITNLPDSPDSQNVDDTPRERQIGTIWDVDTNIDITEVPDTTLLIHFFGSKGRDTLNYKDFSRFMDNLQTEVLQLEFNEFSRGMPTISETEFAKILLRYTTLEAASQQEYLQRVEERIPDEKGITFEEFKKFFQFLNNLDDFTVAMRMYTFANQPISQDEFQRAVKVCVGHTLDKNLVNTVFQIFDTDGDGHLSHQEFISIMKDRLHRGVRSHLDEKSQWSIFKTCVKREIKQNQ
ncbi:calcium uptake protein 3, mitochondrial-like isoform X4 [Tubulanus polymorphus]|uniref:calcium uptake protein 3, mitochondrial-like isoform X4 n=1 Tax=Tubulanus polymorphus TaxID=672921 RepID=UPI003DA36911